MLAANGQLIDPEKLASLATNTTTVGFAQLYKRHAQPSLLDFGGSMKLLKHATQSRKSDRRDFADIETFVANG